MQSPTGVRTQHADYMAMSDKWLRCRDVSAGTDAVHAATYRYLPRLKEQPEEDYAAYVKRATFYNASWRTIAGLVGMMFRKPPLVEAPATLEEMFDDVTLSGVSLHALAQAAAEECLTVGRLGVLVDYPSADVTAQQSVADAAKLNLRPTLATYKTESIINWRRRIVANASVLSLVVLAENAVVSNGDFADVMEMRYRVLDLDEAGFYRVRVFRINARNEDEQVDGDVYPLMGGTKLDFIPFVFVGVDSTTTEVDDPPLIDLIDVNLAHYRVTADYETGCHFAALPTPYVCGYSPATPADKLYIGSTTAWIFTDPATKVGFLEFTGQGLTALTTNMERKEQQMAVLGARMLEALRRGVESAQTASIHRVGEESVLSAISQSVSIGLTQALEWFAKWAGVDGEAKVELNRDFFPVPMDNLMLTALITGWQSGAYSYQTLFDNLKAGEIVSQDSTAESEQAAVATQGPILGAPNNTEPKPTPPAPNVPNAPNAPAKPNAPPKPPASKG